VEMRSPAQVRLGSNLDGKRPEVAR
jgi:hypothetical protein